MKEQKHKILLDLRWLRPGVTGGIEQVALILLKQLSEYPQLEFDFYLLIPRIGKRILKQFETNYFNLVVTDGITQLFQRALGEISSRLSLSVLHNWRQLEKITSDRIRRINPSVVISFIGYIDKSCYPYVNLLILPDLVHEYFPELFSEKDLSFRQKNYTQSLKMANRIIAISRFSEQSATHLLPEIEPKIATGHLGVDNLYTQKVEKDDVSKTLDKFQLTGHKFLIYPANTWPHKNHKVIIEALKILSEQHSIEFHAVFTGSPKDANQSLHDLITALDISQFVHFLGYIPEMNLIHLYHSARLMVFPSLHEGFGIPLLEAMWCQCPIICSPNGSIPEVAGDAALYFDPHSASDLADKIIQLDQDNFLYQKLIRAGNLQKNKFSNKTFAELILLSLRELSPAHNSGHE